MEVSTSFYVRNFSARFSFTVSALFREHSALAHFSDRVTVVLNTGIVVDSRGYYKKDIFGVAGLVKHRVGS